MCFFFPSIHIMTSEERPKSFPLRLRLISPLIHLWRRIELEAGTPIEEKEPLSAFGWLLIQDYVPVFFPYWHWNFRALLDYCTANSHFLSTTFSCHSSPSKSLMSSPLHKDQIGKSYLKRKSMKSRCLFFTLSVIFWSRNFKPFEFNF
jgi:hypothetical protein